MQKEHIHLFNKYLLREYYLPAGDLRAWDTTENYPDKIPPFPESVPWQRAQAVKHPAAEA